MDKAQKSLIDTYFRKRKIAHQQNSRFKLKDFEYNYAFDSDIPVNDIRFEANIIAPVLIRRPEMVNKFDLSQLRGYEMTEILAKQPQLIKNFQPYLSKAYEKDDSIVDVLVNQPELIGYFDLTKIHPYYYADTILRKPELFKYFKPYLHLMKSNDIGYLLSHSLDYLKWFDLNELDSDALARIIIRFPEMIDKIDNAKLGGGALGIIIMRHPQFLKRFINRIDEISVNFMQDILIKHFDYFKENYPEGLPKIGDYFTRKKDEHSYDLIKSRKENGD